MNEEEIIKICVSNENLLLICNKELFDLTIKHCIQYSSLEFFTSYIEEMIKIVELPLLFQKVVSHCLDFMKDDYFNAFYEIIVEEEDVTDEFKEIIKSLNDNEYMKIFNDKYLDINNGEYRLNLYARNKRELNAKLANFNKSLVNINITSSKIYQMKFHCDDSSFYVYSLDQALIHGNSFIYEKIYEYSKKVCSLYSLYEKIYENVHSTLFIANCFLDRNKYDFFFINSIADLLNTSGLTNYEDSIDKLIDFHLSNDKKIDFCNLYQAVEDTDNLFELNQYFIGKNINKQHFFEYCLCIGDVISLRQIMDEIDISKKFTYLNNFDYIIKNVDCLTVLESHDNFYDFLQNNKETLLKFNDKEIINFVNNKI